MGVICPPLPPRRHFEKNRHHIESCRNSRARRRRGLRWRVARPAESRERGARGAAAHLFLTIPHTSRNLMHRSLKSPHRRSMSARTARDVARVSRFFANRSVTRDDSRHRRLGLRDQPTTRASRQPTTDNRRFKPTNARRRSVFHHGLKKMATTTITTVLITMLATSQAYKCVEPPQGFALSPDERIHIDTTSTAAHKNALVAAAKLCASTVGCQGFDTDDNAGTVALKTTGSLATIANRCLYVRQGK